jgi:hypothetical protein
MWKIFLYKSILIVEKQRVSIKVFSLKKEWIKTLFELQ